jgi:hypothetical protein
VEYRMDTGTCNLRSMSSEAEYINDKVRVSIFSLSPR